MKLKALLVVMFISIVAVQGQFIIPFSDLGFSVKVFGNESIVKEALISFSFEGEILIRFTICMNFTNDSVLSVFVFNINDTQLNVTSLEKKVIIESTLIGKGSRLLIKMNLSLESGTLIVLGNSTLEISSLRETVLTNELIFFLYISLYLGAIIVLIYRRVTMQKKGEVIVE